MADLPPSARIRPLATNDLIEAVRYLDSRSESAGDALLDTFREAAQLLADFPRLGPVRRHRGRLRGVRSWPLMPRFEYVIFYLPTSSGIDVLRVLHGARNIERELRK